MTREYMNRYRSTLVGVLFGSEQFVSERDLAVAAGIDLTTVNAEMRRLLAEGKAEREERKVPFKGKQGLKWAWRLKRV